MLRRGVWKIATKSGVTGRRFTSSSTNYRSFTHDNEGLAATNFCRISNVHVERKQTIRGFSDAPNLSKQTEIMDGAGDRKVLTVDYDALLEAQEKGNFIIDVREQSEINETGKLPCSIHIPMGDVVKELENLSSEAFQEKYEKSKPDKATKIIVSCRSGMRSGKVQEQLQKLGYENVYNYTGGWSEWESQQKV